MQAWRVSFLVCGLAVGCGGALPQESAWDEEQTAEAATAWCAPSGDAQRVKTILPPSETIPRFAHGPGPLVEFRGQLYFAVNFEDGRRALWKSAGTEASTTEVKAFPTMSPWDFPWIQDLTPTAETLFFQVNDPATGRELWATDGTPGGTRLVRDLAPGTVSSQLAHFRSVGRTLVFIRTVPAPPNQPESTELWRSDGTAAGTERLVTLATGSSVSWQDFRLTGAALFVVTHPTRGTELWKSDGTTAGTRVVLRLDSGQAYMRDVRAEGNRAFFTLNDEGNTEVWQTDGTSAGTLRLYTFGPNPMPRLLGSIGEYVYLTLSDLELHWMRVYRLRTNVTSSREYVASVPNPYIGQPGAIPDLDNVARTEGKIFFSIFIGSEGPAPRDTQLWVTDGTKAGTKLLRRPLSLSDEYTSPVSAVSNGLVFFSSPDDATGIEPWITDGTSAGTRRLKDVAPGMESSYPGPFQRVGNRVYFNAYDDTRAGQLWSVPLQSTCVSAEH